MYGQCGVCAAKMTRVCSAKKGKGNESQLAIQFSHLDFWFSHGLPFLGIPLCSGLLSSLRCAVNFFLPQYTNHPSTLSSGIQGIILRIRVIIRVMSTG